MTANPHSYGDPSTPPLAMAGKRLRPERDPPYLQGLNKEQREAVLAVERPVLVLKLDRAD
jgi:hypothetical protein